MKNQTDAGVNSNNDSKDCQENCSSSPKMSIVHRVFWIIQNLCNVRRYLCDWLFKKDYTRAFTYIFIGTFLIISSLDLVFQSQGFDVQYFRALIFSCIGFPMCCYGGVTILQMIRKNLDEEAISIAASISNTIAFFLLSVFSLIIAIVAMNAGESTSEKPRSESVAAQPDSTAAAGTDGEKSQAESVAEQPNEPIQPKLEINHPPSINMVRVLLYSLAITFAAFVFLVFWIIFSIIEHVNKKNQLNKISEQNVSHITSREEKGRTLRALLSKSRKVIAYINNAQSFFSEFITGVAVSIQEPITLICPSEVYLKIADEYEKRKNKEDLPPNIHFVVHLPQFTQTVSAIFFFDSMGDISPKHAILLSLNDSQEASTDKEGDAKWFVLSNKNGIAENIYSSYHSIKITPSVCVMEGQKDCQKAIFQLHWKRQFDSKSVTEAQWQESCPHTKADENTEDSHEYPKMELPYCLKKEREHLRIDWLVECSRLLHNEFNNRWRLVQDKQYLDSSERTETNRMMESFAESLQSLHAFDITDLSAWVEKGRLKTFLEKTKRQVKALHSDGQSDSQCKNGVCTKYDEKSLSVKHPHFFGRVFIIESRQFLFDEYEGGKGKSNLDTKQLNGDVLVEVLESHTSTRISGVDEELGVIQTGIVFKEDIKDDRTNSWVVDFAVYDRAITWCKHLKGQGAPNSIGGFSSNRGIVEEYLTIFNQVWNSYFPSLFVLPDKDIDEGNAKSVDNNKFELNLEECFSGKCSRQSRTPAQEAKFLQEHWKIAKDTYIKIHKKRSRNQNDSKEPLNTDSGEEIDGDEEVSDSENRTLP